MRLSTRIITSLLLFLGLCGVANATTYYISQSTGSNTNDGLTKGAPWKSHPYMPVASACSGSGSAPAYTHVAGDQFIFMGGDTWPAACWYINTVLGGSDASHVDYYGVDQTWWNSGVCGGSFCKPIFDAQNTETNAGQNGDIAVVCIDCGVGGPSYITFDGWEVKGQYWTSVAGNSYHDLFAMGGTTCHITIENMYVHHWTHDTFASNTSDVWVFAREPAPPNAPSANICQTAYLNNYVDNSDGSCDSGTFGNAYQISGSVINCVPNIVVGTVYIYTGNVTYHTPNSFDDGDTPGCNPNVTICIHENVFEGWLDAPGQTQIICNNTAHDSSPHGVFYFLDPAFNVGSSGASTLYLCNNVLWGSNNNLPVMLDTNCGNGVTCSQSAMSIYAWNNTVDGTSVNGTCFRLVNRGYGQNVGVGSFINNHCVTNSGSGTAGLITIDPGIAFTTYVNTPNLVMTGAAATSAGYVPGNAYRPTSGSSPTVGVGSNLTSNCGGSLALCTDASGFWNATGTALGSGMSNARPNSGAWDDGAYAFAGASPAPAVCLSPTSLSFGNQTTMTTSGGRDVTLTNCGTATLTISSIALTTGTQYAISANACGGTLASLANCVVTVTFTPTTAGAKSDSLVFTTDASTSPDSDVITGTGVSSTPSATAPIGIMIQ